MMMAGERVVHCFRHLQLSGPVFVASPHALLQQTAGAENLLHTRRTACTLAALIAHIDRLASSRIFFFQRHIAPFFALFHAACGRPFRRALSSSCLILERHVHLFASFSRFDLWLNVS